MNLEQDALDAYEAAQKRLKLLVTEWERLGRPVLAKGSKGQLVGHPLLAEIRAADRLADHLRRRLVRRHRGPEPSAVIKPRQNRITRVK